MIRRSKTYQLEYFKGGDPYSAGSDLRRFLTVDYNMKSYVGITGNGIISGWTIQHNGGLNISIIPGTGVINGCFAQSPYIVELRSAMVMGNREISVLPNPSTTPYTNLNPTERTQYVSVIQSYNPSYNPIGDIENAYVQVSNPDVSLALFNNSDNYIWATLSHPNQPYPGAEGYPGPAGIPPIRGNYSNYYAYQAALDIYNAKLAAIHNWQWYSVAGNHFTEVTYHVAPSFTLDESKVLLANVVTRSNNVTKIDVSQVNDLQNMASAIKKYALTYISKHKHGGNKAYDPPKVRLETDIRNTVLSDYDYQNGKVVVDILEKDNTSTESSHYHTYKMDSSGNGTTIGQVDVSGRVLKHFHLISEYVVDNPFSSEIEAHIHTVKTAEEQGDTFIDGSSFVVYINDIAFGDETSTNLSVNYDTKQITINRGVSISPNSFIGRNVNVQDELEYRQYSRDISDYITNKISSGVASKFLVFAQYKDLYGNAFNYCNTYFPDLPQPLQKYQVWGNSDFYGYLNFDALPMGLDFYPALFGYTFTDTFGIHDLALPIQGLLTKIGDKCSFVMSDGGFDEDWNIALNSTPMMDKVTIEILDNVEVSGKLKTENIVLVNADRILKGELSIDVLPMISHVGRWLEELLPTQYPLVTNDAIRWSVLPLLTSVTQGHSHKLYLDKLGNGTTTYVLVGNEPVYYMKGLDGKSYFVGHSHSVSDFNVAGQSSTGLTGWLNSINETSVAVANHTHDILYSVKGNDKTVYAIKEDRDGNIYAGTSDGLMMVPSLQAYLFTLNNYEFYVFGNDLWQAFNDAVAQYQRTTDKIFIVTEEIYRDKITDAALLLINDGDSALFEGIGSPDRLTDKVMVKKISSFKVPNFRSIEDKPEYDLLDNETVISTHEVLVNDGVIVEEIGIDGVSETNSELELAQEVTMVTASRELNNTPIWSLELKTSTIPGEAYLSSAIDIDILAVGSDLISMTQNLNRSPYQSWKVSDYPLSVGVIRKILRASNGDYWTPTNNGLLVSRSYINGRMFITVGIPGNSVDVRDVVEGRNNYIYCATDEGIFITTNGGKDWTSILSSSVGFKQIVRDFSKDKSNTVSGHYHNVQVDIEGNGFLEESVGSGAPHVHQISWWTISESLGHTHYIVPEFYALDNDNILWKSNNNVANWIEYGSLPSGENGEIFAAFGKVLVSNENGLYSTDNGSEWTVVLKKKVYSYAWDYNLTGLLIGCDNVIYRTYDGITFEIVYSFSGNPSSVMIKNSVRQYFGYAYNNQTQTMHLKNMLVPDSNSSDEIAAMVDYSKWYAPEGSWLASSPYDVYIDNKRVLSTKYNEDLREAQNISFEVNPLNGMVDFSAQSILLKAVVVGDKSIVADPSGFMVGDIIWLKNANYYASITDVSADNWSMELDSAISRSISLPETVVRITGLNRDSVIKMNIYDSVLGNIGTFTHDEVEDKLSYFTDGRPYKLNDTYLSNLLQLTQGLRYVYPDINSLMKNDLFYDFRYKSMTHPTYPDITDYIDVDTSAIYNQKIYDSNFVPKSAKSINKVLIGYGDFDDTIIVATDIGIFWSHFESNYEANWFYVYGFEKIVYDITIFNGSLVAATDEGIYYTTDMENWTYEISSIMNYPIYTLETRWKDLPVVTIPAHSATFSTVNGVGYITATTGTPYASLLGGRGINVTNTTSKNGYYKIVNVADGGAGYGSQIIVAKSLGSTEVNPNTNIVMGTWSQQWDGDINRENPSITNTLLTGGKNHISHTDDLSIGWEESQFSNSDFSVAKFLPLSKGSVLSTINSNSGAGVIQCLDSGSKWNYLKEIKSIGGNISAWRISDENNTVLTVDYFNTNSYMDGNLDKREIQIYEQGLMIFSGKIIWNKRMDGVDTITVYSNIAAFKLIDGGFYTFKVVAPKVSSMVQSSNTVFFGTDNGLFTDRNTIINIPATYGTISNAGINAVVTSLDFSGKIKAVSTNSRGNSVLSIIFNVPVIKNELVGYVLYVTDTFPVEQYTVITNSASLVTGETEITILIPTTPVNVVGANTKPIVPLTSFYIGKRVVVAGTNSRLYVDFDLPVLDDSFNGGIIYLKSDETVQYSIIKNTSSYIEISVLLVPISTVQGVVRTNNGTIGVGPNSKIRLLNNNQLTLWTSFTNEFKENELEGVKFEFLQQFTTTTTTSTSLTTTTTTPSLSNVNNALGTTESLGIISNTENSLVLSTTKPFAFNSGDTFKINGTIFDSVDSFNRGSTSIDSDHYHDVEVVGKFVYGKIDTFGTVNSALVEINVIDAINFNTSIVQLRGDLFNEAKIVFTNNDNVNMRYVTTVVSHTPTTITVNIKDPSYWDYASYSDSKISSGWKWSIDAGSYGYTNNTYYSDFNVLSRNITATCNIRSQNVVVDSSAGFVIGDTVKIQDDSGSFEMNSIDSIIDSTHIKVVNGLSKTYYNTRNPILKVLRDTFANNHVHQIRSNEVELINVPSYAILGYYPEHAHRVLPLISSITSLLLRNNEIIAGGSGSKLYNSTDNGSTWTQLVDLNDYREKSEEVKGVSNMILNGSRILASSITGNIFVEDISDQSVVNIRNPK